MTGRRTPSRATRPSGPRPSNALPKESATCGAAYRERIMPGDVVALTFALNQIEAAVLTGFGLIRGDVAHIYNTLIGLSLALTLTFWMLDGRQFAHIRLVGQFVLFAVVGWILRNFERITDAVFDTTIGTGLKAGGSSMSAADFQDPGK